jgi:hypothetical protein
MAKNIQCHFRPSKLLLDYPEFWRKECDLRLGKVIGGNEVVLRPEDIKSASLIPKSEHVLNETLIIHSNHADKYIVDCNTDDVEWFNTLARKFVEEFEQGGNDFIYYRNEDGKVLCNRRIVCAAMRIDGVVVLGARHGSPLMNQAIDHAFEHDEERIVTAMNLGRDEGFIDQYDVFWDRKQALTIAICADQIRKRTSDREQLWSEDVW